LEHPRDHPWTLVVLAAILVAAALAGAASLRKPLAIAPVAEP
jgi:hypothetical protein